jgi:hypothetical protein
VIPEPFSNLIVVGLVLLLIMLRLDAERFGAAEYDEAARDGHLPSFRRRLAWYLLGIASRGSATTTSGCRTSGRTPARS